MNNRRRDALSLFEDMRKGRVLDIPAGQGDESSALRRLGHEVFSADLFPPMAGDGALRWVRADANDAFPFGESTFDYVLSREGIEHLENQAGFVRECYRVLRLDGTIVLTTPNMMHLSARVSQFLTGQRNLKRGLANEVQTLRAAIGSHLYHGHIFMIDYFKLRYLLRVAGFDGIEVHTDKYSPTAIALSWSVPALFAMSRWAIIAAERKAARKLEEPAPREVLREIQRHVFSSALLFGKRMIITARKTAAAR